MFAVQDSHPLMPAAETIGTGGLGYWDCFPKQKWFMAALRGYWVSAEGFLGEILAAARSAR